MATNRPRPLLGNPFEGNRIAAFRRLLGKSQEQLATEIGLTRDQLANIESGRTSLKFSVGWKICRQMNMDQLYLATGDSPESPFHDINLSEGDYRIDETADFAMVCCHELKSELVFRRSMAGRKKGAATPGTTLANYERTIGELAKTFLMEIPPDSRPLLLEHLTKSLREFTDSVKEMEQTVSRTETHDLTTVTENSTTGGEMSEIAKLMLDVKRCTEAPGKKADLARRLQVPQSRISEWLSGKYEPGGEIALRLLSWVQAEKLRK